ncbi:MAG: ABC transporter ATP-binding protein [Victivallales bacterium]|nr:ABC transporter ATP-binding protein [Victivallales bacterium]
MQIESEDIPAWLGESVGQAHPGEEIVVALCSDISRHRVFGEEWIAATGKRVMVLCAAGEKGGEAEIRHDIDFATLKGVSVNPLVGASALIAEPADGAPVRLISFSRSLGADFSHAADVISLLIKGQEAGLAGAVGIRTTCPKCGKPVPEELNKCPRCTDRTGTILRIAQYALPYKWTLVLMILSMLLGTGFGLITPYMSKLFIDVILKPDDLTGVFERAHWLVPASVALFLAYAAQMSLGGVQERLSGYLGYHTVADVRSRIYERLQELSLSFFDKHQSGALLARVNQDTQEMQRLLVSFIPMTVESGLMFFGIGIFLFLLSWHLTLFVLIPVVLMALFFKLVLPRFWVYMQRFFHRRAKLTAAVSDSLSGIRVIKAFGQEKVETEKFESYSRRYRDAGVEVTRRWSIFHPMFHLLIMSGMVIVWLVGGFLVVRGEMTIGSVVAYSGYLMMFYRPVFMLIRMLDQVTHAVSAAERVFEVIDTEPQIKDSRDARSLPEVRGELEFRDVSFGYDKFKPVLKGINLKISEGEMIGLVGRSGAGKSTLINLICRLYDPDGGEIQLDGMDMRQVRQTDLRKSIGIVLQETFLFNGTIYENISYTRPDATREDVISAAEAANAHEFILRKPDGYDTEVGERGGGLSGGERQRISIARAILRDPSILILDEATSSVDTQTEKKIQEALERLTKGRTTIAIAHRLSTLRRCDRIVVIDKGTIAEAGTHRELMGKKGLFHEMAQMQKEMSRIMLFDGGEGDQEKAHKKGKCGREGDSPGDAEPENGAVKFNDQVF